jgi:hypothetical protein
LTGPEHSSGTARTAKKAHELSRGTLFLIDLFLDEATTTVNQAESIRVVMSNGAGVVKVLKSTGIVRAQVHVLHGHTDISDEPTVSRITQLHVSGDGKLVYMLESGEQFVADSDSEPVRLSPLPYVGAAASIALQADTTA